MPTNNQFSSIAIQKALDSKTKPLGALGRLEDIAAQVAQIQQTLNPVMNTCTLIIFAADHGIANQKVSAYPQQVTRQMVINYLQDGAAANVIAKTLGVNLKIVDAGIAGQTIQHPKLIHKPIASGTADFSQQPAMSKQQLKQAIHTGTEIAESTNSDALAFGEMGIGNTSAAACIAHKILNIPLNQLIGRGTGLDDAGMKHKLEVLTKAAQRTPDHLGYKDALTEYGGFEIAMITGAIVKAVQRKQIVIIDGIIATAAAIAALDCKPDILHALIFAHQSAERGHKAMLDAIKAHPIFNLDMRLGEGTGALLAWPIIKASVAILNDMATFESAGVSQKL